MSDTTTCPDCDEKVLLRSGRDSVRCPACGSRFAVERATARGGRRKADEDEDEPKQKKHKRKYREEWDDDEDDEPVRQPAKRGSLAWLWILLGVLAFVAAGCFGGVWWLMSLGKQAQEDFAKRRAVEEQEAARRDEEFRRQFNAQPGNPQGRQPPPPQPHAAAYPKVKPFDADPKLVGAAGTVYLDDLSPFDVKQGDWPVGRHGALGYDNRWVCVNGTYHDHGIGMIPPNFGAARMSFAVGGQARRLTGRVANNDYWHDGDARDAVTFAVYRDGKEVWRSPPVRKRKESLAFDVDVTGARVITLETNAPKSAHDAHCVWLDPQLMK
jgi:uncharacterized Zn finger protein (UPF0148 family)